MASSVEILRTFRFRPRLAPELMRDVLRASLPMFDGVRVEALEGGKPLDGAPLAIVLTRGREAVQAIVVEAPMTCENPSRMQWPRWRQEVSQRTGAPTLVLIVTSDLVVERWAQQPVHLEGGTFQPNVLGPSSISTDQPQTTPVLLLMTLASLVTRDA